MEPFISPVTEEEIKQEKTKAQRLRRSQWWRRKCAQGICFFCKKKIPPRELTMEHIVPACKECNNKKKYLLPIEWEEYLEQLNKDPWG